LRPRRPAKPDPDRRAPARNRRASARSGPAKSRATAPEKRPRLGIVTRAVSAGTPHGAGREQAGASFARLGPAGETPHALPIHQGSNFAYPSSRAAAKAAAGQAFLYGRHGSPTVVALESALADLEDGEAALAFGSGMAAVATAVLTLGAGGEVLASEAMYGGTTELLAELGARQGIRVRFVPAWQTEAVEAALSADTRVLLVETLSNPLLRLPDLAALPRLARRVGAALVVDNTTATPLLMRPLRLGASVVVHSLSKYIAGHGDVIGGLVVASAEIIAKMRRYRTLLGAVMDPFCAWLALRGLRTMAVRVQRQGETALRLARFLQKRPEVRAVHHPALKSHPDHDRARRLLQGFGAMITFELRDEAAARRFYDRVSVISRAASFGEVTSLLTHPATFSHKGLPRKERDRLGIRGGLLRLSVGLEDARDLQADILYALAR
jgi:methionine-gamma-lyase